MDEIAVKVRRNDLICRLQKLAQDMTERNDHDEAFLVDLAVQALQADKPAVLSGGGGSSGAIEALGAGGK